MNELLLVRVDSVYTIGSGWQPIIMFEDRVRVRVRATRIEKSLI